MDGPSLCPSEGAGADPLARTGLVGQKASVAEPVISLKDAMSGPPGLRTKARQPDQE